MNIDFDKAKLQKELDNLLMKKKIFLIVGLSLFCISIILTIIYVVMVVQKTISDNTSIILTVSSNILFCAGIVILVLRSALYSYKINVRKAILSGQVQFVNPDSDAPESVSIVDIGEVEDNHVQQAKTKEQELVDQYEDLYKKGYITKEDFEAKKKELLN